MLYVIDATHVSSCTIHHLYRVTPCFADFFSSNPHFLEFKNIPHHSIRCFSAYSNTFSSSIHKMSYLYADDTPADVKDAKGLHLVTQSTPNGQKVQIFLEELALVYGTTWTTTLINIATNEQKKDWFLRLDPNGRIPIIIDNTQNPPFPVMETSAELLYLLKKYDKDDAFGFKDELERSQALQWLFFWHGISPRSHRSIDLH